MGTIRTSSDLPPEEAPGTSAIERLMHQDEFSPKELAELLDEPLSLIEHDAFAGRLKATIVDHHITGISREAVLEWMSNRG